MTRIEEWSNGKFIGDRSLSDKAYKKLTPICFKFFPLCLNQKLKKMKYLISILMMCSCVLTKVNAQHYQMEALDPEKNSKVIFYSDPETDTMSMSLKNVDSLRVVLPQPSEVANLTAIEVRLKDNDDLRLFVEQSYFVKERQAYFIELRNSVIANLLVKNRNGGSERRDKLTTKDGKIVADKILIGKTWLGMTEEMLLDVKGRPAYFEETNTDKGVSQLYIYSYFGGCGMFYEYYHFENGKLTKVTF